jgi:DNA helicase-2/ATP-dependent DNA helicase PcrA
MSFDPRALPDLLNPEQLEAVRYQGGPLLVLAGAGSGKTRVITYRIANAVVEHGVAPWKILAVTFTNKAAGEMRERLEKLLGPDAGQAWVSTFHSLGAQLLRREGSAIGLTKDFLVYDDSDQLAELKRVMKAMGVDPKQVEPRRILSRIDDAKNHGRSPADLAKKPGYDELSRLTPEIYRRYQEALARANAVDFGDLLTRVVELFEKAPEVCAHYRRRFRHLLVDEFQDVNSVQYRMLRMLAGDGRGLCCVGDDDQAIYGWRGADVSCLLSFEHDFPGAKIVKLERNYRSTQTILDAAHAVIVKNPRRMDKRLWTDRAGGAAIELMVSPTERDEAAFVARQAKDAIARGVEPTEIAVFYRTNAQSRAIEEAFRLSRLPYAVIRGRSFYDRAEVKDLASYLRLAVNPRSDQDALRVINTPPRGIGDTTVARLEDAARGWGVPLVEACMRAREIPGLQARAQEKLLGFARIVGEIIAVAVDGSAGAAAHAALEHSGMETAFRGEGTDEAMDRLENVKELVGAAEEWDAEYEPPADPEGRGEAPPALAAFLEQISLLGDADQKVSGPKISLMTLHAAKGLEFEEVYLTGLEEGVFPHNRALADEAGPGEMEEERRLCYVGFTRAKKRLVLSLASSRALWGDLRFNPPSRFLGDVPRELFAGVPAGARSPARSPSAAPAGNRVVYDENPGFHDEGPDIDLGDDDGFDEGYRIDYSDDPRHRPAAPARPPLRSARPPLVRRPPNAAPVGLAFRTDGPAAFAIGARVNHAQFGGGVVEEAAGDKITVRFASVGVKRVIARFLQPA